MGIITEGHVAKTPFPNGWREKKPMKPKPPSKDHERSDWQRVGRQTKRTRNILISKSSRLSEVLCINIEKASKARFFTLFLLFADRVGLFLFFCCGMMMSGGFYFSNTFATRQAGRVGFFFFFFVQRSRKGFGHTRSEFIYLCGASPVHLCHLRRSAETRGET